MWVAVFVNEGVKVYVSVGPGVNVWVKVNVGPATVLVCEGVADCVPVKV